MEREVAVRAVRAGAYTGIILAVLGALLFFLARHLQSSEGLLGHANDVFMLFGAAVYGGLAIGLVMRSRVAAVLLPLGYVGDRVLMLFFFPEQMTPAGLLIAVCVTMLLIRAAQGVFALRRLDAEEGIVPAPLSGWRRALVGSWLIAVIGLFVSGVLLFAIMGSSALDLDTVVTGDRMRSSDRALLEEAGVLHSKEEVLYFYTWGFLSAREGGVFLTPRGLTMYEEDGEQHYRTDIAYGEITGIEEIPAGSSWEAAEIAVYRVESDITGDWIQLVLPKARNGHNQFMGELKRRAARH